MLVHVWHKLKCKLYLFKSVTNDSIVGSTSFISTGVSSSRSFFDKLSQSLLHISICFLLRRSHHTAFNVCNHEEKQGHEEENWNCAKQSINNIFSLRVIFFSFCEFVHAHWVSVHYVLEPRCRFPDSRVPHLTHF